MGFVLFLNSRSSIQPHCNVQLVSVSSFGPVKRCILIFVAESSIFLISHLNSQMIIILNVMTSVRIKIKITLILVSVVCHWVGRQFLWTVILNSKNNDKSSHPKSDFEPKLG